MVIYGKPSAWRTLDIPKCHAGKIIRAEYPGHSLDIQVVGGPDWVRTAEFDISARASNDKATRDELTEMARSLLAERFKLVLRTEGRDTSGSMGSSLFQSPAGERLMP